MSRRAPLHDVPGPRVSLRNYLVPGYAWWRVTVHLKYAALRTWCLIVGHRDGQHWRQLFVNGDDLFADETPWCDRCGTDAA